jgi:hypothetical protein
MNDIFYGIGNAFQKSFTILPYIGGIVNVIFILTIFFGICAWIWWMQGEAKKPEHEQYPYTLHNRNKNKTY